MVIRNNTLELENGKQYPNLMQDLDFMGLWFDFDVKPQVVPGGKIWTLKKVKNGWAK